MLATAAMFPSIDDVPAQRRTTLEAASLIGAHFAVPLYRTVRRATGAPTPRDEVTVVPVLWFVAEEEHAVMTMTAAATNAPRKSPLLTCNMATSTARGAPFARTGNDVQRRPLPAQSVKPPDPRIKAMSTHNDAPEHRVKQDARRGMSLDADTRMRVEPAHNSVLR